MGVLLSSVPVPALADGFEDDDDIEEDLNIAYSTDNAEKLHENAIDTDSGPVDADEMSFDEDARLFAQPPVETATDPSASNEDSMKINADAPDSQKNQSQPLDEEVKQSGNGIATTAGVVAGLGVSNGGPSSNDDDDAPPMHELDSPSSTSNGAVIEIKNGAKSGQILPIDKPVTTLGRPGIQIAAIMRKPDGYFLMHIESDDSVDRPTLNRDAIGDEPVLLHSGDELNVAGIDVEFMLS